MIKKALFTLCSAMLVLAIAGCDDGTTPIDPGMPAAQLPEGVEPFKPPAPGTVPTVERPGAEHAKTSSGG